MGKIKLEVKSETFGQESGDIYLHLSDDESGAWDNVGFGEWE